MLGSGSKGRHSLSVRWTAIAVDYSFFQKVITVVHFGSALCVHQPVECAERQVQLSDILVTGLMGIWKSNWFIHMKPHSHKWFTCTKYWKGKLTIYQIEAKWHSICSSRHDLNIEWNIMLTGTKMSAKTRLSPGHVTQEIMWNWGKDPRNFLHFYSFWNTLKKNIAFSTCSAVWKDSSLLS